MYQLKSNIGSCKGFVTQVTKNYIWGLVFKSFLVAQVVKNCTQRPVLKFPLPQYRMSFIDSTKILIE